MEILKIICESPLSVRHGAHCGSFKKKKKEKKFEVDLSWATCHRRQATPRAAKHRTRQEISCQHGRGWQLSSEITDKMLGGALQPSTHRPLRLPLYVLIAISTSPLQGLQVWLMSALTLVHALALPWVLPLAWSALLHGAAVSNEGPPRDSLSSHFLRSGMECAFV
ncbi:hypothetical protein H1C71_021090 [Ictidomys tridecemlineatus]|nr:hypothetical protein H1C71_021090 [Ictidomys tridecemlineatus]